MVLRLWVSLLQVPHLGPAIGICGGPGLGVSAVGVFDLKSLFSGSLVWGSLVSEVPTQLSKCLLCGSLVWGCLSFLGGAMVLPQWSLGHQSALSPWVGHLLPPESSHGERPAGGVAGTLMCPQTIRGRVWTAEADPKPLLREAPKSLPDFRDAVASPLSPPRILLEPHPQALSPPWFSQSLPRPP